MPIETNKAKKSMITDATVTTPYSEGLNIRANIAEIISDIKKQSIFLQLTKTPCQHSLFKS